MGSKETKEPKPKVAKFCLTRWPDLPVGTDPTFDAVDKLAKYVFENSYPDVATLRQRLRSYKQEHSFDPDPDFLDMNDLADKRFLAILGSTGEIRQFRMELLKAKITCIKVNERDILEVACAYPKKYPDDALLVIGSMRVFSKIHWIEFDLSSKKAEQEMVKCLDDPAWEVAENVEIGDYGKRIARQQLETSEKFNDLLESLMTKLATKDF